MSTSAFKVDFEALFAVTPAALLVLAPDDHFTIVAVNDRYLAATMTTRLGIVGRGLFDVFPDNPTDPNATGVANLRRSLERVCDTRRPDRMALQKYDIRRPPEDGAGFEERWWSPTNTPVLDAGGQVASIIHCVEDVTELQRLRAVNRLATERDTDHRRLLAVLDQSPLAVVVAEAPSGNIVFSNAHMRRVFGAATDQFPVERALLGETVTNEVVQVVHANGSRNEVMVNATPVRDALGEIVAAVAVGWDVTEQRRYEEQLRRAQSEAEWSRERTGRLQALSAALSVAASPNDIADALVTHGAPVLDAVGIIVARATSDGDALEIARAGDLPEVIRMEWERIPLESHVPLADAARTRSPIFLEGRADWQARYPDLIPLLDSTGHRANCVAPILASGELLGVIGAAYDHEHPFDDVNRTLLLTVAEQVGLALQRARLLEAEQAARKEAELANSAKSQFLAVMSHELRTPLNAIGGHAELIEMGIHGPLTAEQRTALERIQRSQRHLLGLINSVLNYAKVDAGAVQYAAEMVVLDEVLATCEALIAPQARAKGLALTYSGCDRLTQLWADREKLQQVVLNLLSNAVKFTEPGGVVTISCASDAQRVSITVRDTGRGIPADQLERVFQPFVQLDVRLTRTQEGTGLGLSISRDLARGMGGDLVVESAEGVGSTFTLTLPARAP